MLCHSDLAARPHSGASRSRRSIREAITWPNKSEGMSWQNGRLQSPTYPGTLRHPMTSGRQVFGGAGSARW
jgi:hypothetical protein